MTRPFDILATKGIYPVAAAAKTRDGVWYMAREGWRQYGSDQLEPYDKHKATVANDVLTVRPGIRWRALGWSLVVVTICASLMGLLVVGR
jgi:hypothetical protein